MFNINKYETTKQSIAMLLCNIYASSAAQLSTQFLPFSCAKQKYLVKMQSHLVLWSLLPPFFLPVEEEERTELLLH